MQIALDRHAQSAKKAPAKGTKKRQAMASPQRTQATSKATRPANTRSATTRAATPNRGALLRPAPSNKSAPARAVRENPVRRVEPRPSQGRKVNSRIRPRVAKPALHLRLAVVAQRSWQRLVSLCRWLGWLLLRVALVIAVVGIVWGLPKAIERLNPVIEQVAIHGTLNRLERQHLQSQLEQVAQGRFFSVDLEAIKAPLVELPWIRDVEVKRIWPAAISVRVVEQQPVARWGDKALLNDAGEPFYPPSTEGYEQLPMLTGPDHLGKEILGRYQQIKQQLERAGIQCAGLGYDPAGGWWLLLESQIKVQLGSHDVDSRIDHLASLLRNTLKPALTRVAAIDLRYPSAAAVRWREQN